MKRIRHVPGLFLVLLLTGCSSSGAPPPVQPVPIVSATPLPTTRAFVAKHVVILVMDGPRWSETWGEPTRQYIPHMATELAPQGALWMDFTTDGATQTTAGHVAMTTGIYQDIHNGGEELPQRPSIFQRLIKANNGNPDVAWLVSSKDKLAVLTDCLDPAWRGRWLARSDCGIGGGGLGSGYRDDADTLKRVLEILGRHHPRFMLVNFMQPDAAGHGKDWPGYVQGIRDGDRAVKQVWELVQNDPIYRGTTDLFVTNDHGRHPDGHKDGFVSHGDDCAGCRKISLLALGPDIPAGAIFTKHRSLSDLGVTVAQILGVQHEGATGQVLEEVLNAPKP